MNKNPLIFAVFILVSVLAVAIIVHFIARDAPRHNQDRIHSFEAVKEQ